MLIGQTMLPYGSVYFKYKNDPEEFMIIQTEQPLILPACNLIEQVMFPTSINAMEDQIGFPERFKALEKNLGIYLEKFNKAELLERFPLSLSFSLQEWNARLSHQEKVLLTFLRVFLKEERPKFVIIEFDPYFSYIIRGKSVVKVNGNNQSAEDNAEIHTGELEVYRTLIATFLKLCQQEKIQYLLLRPSGLNSKTSEFLVHDYFDSQLDLTELEYVE